MHRHQIFGCVIRKLRQMAVDGRSPVEIFEFIHQRCLGEWFLSCRYLDEAFLKRGWFRFRAPPIEGNEVLEQAWRNAFQEHRIEWEANPFPELIHLRDYFSFLQFAQQEQVIVTVCGGNRFHDGYSGHSYRLHGIYRARTYEPVWSYQNGERLRASLNRHLGAELVRTGPHDDWAHRNDRRSAGPLWGPQLPVIEIGPDQTIDNLLNVADLASRPQYRYGVRWNELYPHHAARKEA